MSISHVLGERRELSVGGSSVRYREIGEGSPLLFVHGLIVNGDLWRKVVPDLAPRYRCITPDWPLGSHEVPFAPDVRLTIDNVVDLVAETARRLELENLTLVGNDTGGAICQLVAVRHPDLVKRLVLTPCDAFDNFPPRMFRYLEWGARVPGALDVLAQSTRLPKSDRLPFTYGWLAKRPIDKDVMRSYTRPGLGNRFVRRDIRNLLLGLSPEYTQETARKLTSFEGPALLVWPREDRFFPCAHAERLAAIIPDATLDVVEDSYSFVPEDRPDALAASMNAFLERTAVPK